MKRLENLIKSKFLIVDFEGYFYFDNFFIKEFGYFNFGSIKTLYIKTKQRKFYNYFWLVKNFHKIPYDFGTVPFDSVLEILKQEKDKIILVKGEAKARILSKLCSNLIINLEIVDCPGLKHLETSEAPCIYHAIFPSDHCVKLKISKILNWMKNESRFVEFATGLAQADSQAE